MSYIFRKESEIEAFNMKHAHKGDGSIIVKQLLGDIPGSGLIGFPNDFETPVNFVHVVTLPKGSSIGDHAHPSNEEFYYIIEGTGRMMVDGRSLTMPKGSIFLIKKGSHHSFHNDEDKDLIAMVMEVEYS